MCHQKSHTEVVWTRGLNSLGDGCTESVVGAPVSVDRPRQTWQDSVAAD